MRILLLCAVFMGGLVIWSQGDNPEFQRDLLSSTTGTDIAVTLAPGARVTSFKWEGESGRPVLVYRTRKGVGFNDPAFDWVSQEPVRFWGLFRRTVTLMETP